MEKRVDVQQGRYQVLHLGWTNLTEQYCLATNWLGKGSLEKDLVDKNSNISHQYVVIVKMTNQVGCINMNVTNRLKDVIISLY